MKLGASKSAPKTGRSHHPHIDLWSLYGNNVPFTLSYITPKSIVAFNGTIMLPVAFVFPKASPGVTKFMSPTLLGMKKCVCSVLLKRLKPANSYRNPTPAFCTPLLEFHLVM